MPTHLTTTDIGTTAGKVVALDGSAKLPAVDGSALTNITAGVTTGQLAGGTLPASFTTLAASGAFTATTAAGSHAITSTVTGSLAFATANVLALKHSNVNGASAIQLLRSSDGFEVGAIGYKNAGGTVTYLDGAVYIASGIYGPAGETSATVIPIIIGQESTGGINAHMTFTAAREITLHNAAGTVNTVISAAGSFHMGSTGATATNQKLDVIGNAAFGSYTLQSDRNSDANGKGVLIVQINGEVMRLVKSGVVGVDFTINGTSGTRRMDLIDKDNSSIIPLSIGLAGTGRNTLGGPITMKGYTVATLPTGVIGDHAYVTDALAPTFLATIVGGGAIKTPVFFDGTNWIGG